MNIMLISHKEAQEGAKRIQENSLLCLLCLFAAIPFP